MKIKNKKLIILVNIFLIFSLFGCNTTKTINSIYVTGSNNGEPISTKEILKEGSLPISYLVNAYSVNPKYIYLDKYFVSSSTGDDNNDGKSEEKPFKTLKKLTEITFKPGDGIFLKSGDTFKESAEFKGDGSAEKPVVITSYGTGAKPFVESEKDVLLFKNRSGWTIDGIAVKISTQAELRSNENGIATQRAIYFEYIGDSKGKYSDISVINCDISGAGYDKNNQGVILMAAYSDVEYATITNVKINNNVFHDIGWLGTATIAWNGAKNGALAIPGVYNNVDIMGNYFYNIGHLGSYTHGVQKGRFMRNYGHDIGIYANPEGAGWGMCGFMTIGTENFDIMYNEFHSILDANVGFDGVGIDIDWSSSFIRVKYNYTYDCYGSGISTMASRDSYISNNRVKGNKVKTYVPKGQITLSDFQADVNPLRMTGISGYGINQNLIYVDVGYTSAFGGFIATAGKEWTKNSFIGNRVVVTNQNDTRMINMIGASKIDSFEDNYYFTSKKFKATLENEKIGFSDFKEWQNSGRDKNGKLLPLDVTAPIDFDGLEVNVEDTKVTVKWNPSMDQESGVWHYNIHLGNDSISVPVYVNLLGETSNTNFVFDTPISKGKYKVMVTAENNMGMITNKAVSADFDVK